MAWILRTLSISCFALAAVCALYWWWRMLETVLMGPHVPLGPLLVVVALFSGLQVGAFAALGSVILRLGPHSPAARWLSASALLASLGLAAGNLLYWITPVLGAPVLAAVLVVSLAMLYLLRFSEVRGGG